MATVEQAERGLKSVEVSRGIGKAMEIAGYGLSGAGLLMLADLILTGGTITTATLGTIAMLEGIGIPYVALGLFAKNQAQGDIDYYKNYLES